MNQLKIDTNALYTLTSQNGNENIVTGDCLLHCYLKNSCNNDVTYRKIVGEWYEILYKGKMLFCRYAESGESALDLVRDDILNLKYSFEDIEVVKCRNNEKPD